MATFFGEVLPLYSRAVDDDEDCNFKIPAVVLENKNSEEDVKDDYQTIIIAHGKTSAIFVEAYLLNENASHVSSIILRFPQEASNDIELCDLESSHQKPYSVIGNIYRCADVAPTLVCVFPNADAVWPEISFDLTKQILGLTKSVSPNFQVLIITSLPASNFKTEQPSNSLVTPFVRMLPTSSYPAQEIKPAINVFPKLEQPNIISGLPAAVITECEVMKIPGLLFVCYTDISDSHLENCKAFVPAISHVSSFRRCHVNTDSEQKLMRLANKNITDQCNLYI